MRAKEATANEFVGKMASRTDIIREGAHGWVVHRNGDTGESGEIAAEKGLV